MAINKHAYLIIAHNQFDLLHMLCASLDSPTHDFYIHIDAKVKDFEFEHFGDFLKYSKVYYVDRVNVSWGGFSMVQAELNLLKAAAGSGYSYYHLLSGQDLPLKSSEEIDHFFEEHEGIEFVHFVENERTFSDNIQTRTRYYHFLRERIGRHPGLLWLVERCSLKMQKLLGVDRRGNIEFYYGSQWFSITHRCAEYALQYADWIKEHFQWTLCPDEHWLQTLLYASDFRPRIQGLKLKGDDYHGCMRYIDWEHGNPYVFRLSDYEHLRRSDYLFARKFDLSVDRDICEKLYRDLIEQCE